ncbi:MAG: AAA domain-containing protein [Chloroflexi bacterium]|nr:AAA family ATPase [Chloroflexota bacterium]NOG62293.1 AAA domain-containing protein [Chloroflexota bacterium]
MKFKFHLYVQKHRNRTYTVTVLPFYDISSYGINMTEIKKELSDVVIERIAEMPPNQLHRLEFDSHIYLQKVQVELRPVDRKKRNKRREKVKLLFSVLVEPQEDGQLYVTVPKLGPHGPAFYVYQPDELQTQANIELAGWLDNLSLDQLMEYRYARTETLETLEVEVSLKKPKERESNNHERGGMFGRGGGDGHWALKEMGINLTAQTTEKRFRKAYHREEVVDKAMQVLLQSRNNSVLLTGPSESGKTSIVHEIVRRVASQDAPEGLVEREIWMLAPDRIIAGAQYIGTWEERINDLVNECRKKQHILYVSDLPGLLEIGRWSKSDANVAQALKPHIASGEVVIIGEGSPDRVTMGERLGSDFMNLFRRVDVPAMSEEETLAVLSNVARDLEREFDLRIEPSANEAATQLSRRFSPYRAFPGKAIRLLEEAVADVSRKKDSAESDNGRDAPTSASLLRRLPKRAVVKRQHVIDTFARHSGMPEFIVNDRSRLDLAEVEKYFMERVRGQEQAVGSIVSLVATVKAGLNDPGKPLGTFLFIGPTGVGKTFLAKTLASYLFGDEKRLIRFDMSEYADLDGVSRLIGSFGSEGELTKQVRAQPFSVVLLDEFEKASPRIYDIFLQVLGEGRLTDAGGRTTFFHNSIIILTSNLGTSAGGFRGLGFGSENVNYAELNAQLMVHFKEQVEKYFRPEFVNRIDHVVVFKQLEPLALRSIASRELGEILMRDGITRRNLLVEIDDAVIDLVLEKGYSPQYGARPLKREIERLVVAPMAHQLAQKSVDDTELMRIEVDRESKQINLKLVPIDEARTTTQVALSTALDGTDIQKLQMDTGQLLEGFAMLRRRLADWADSDTVKEMNTEKAALLTATQQPDFWDKGDEARRRLARFYFLDRLTRRLRQLLERCEYLEDFAMLVNRERDLRYQPDLARDYAELYSNVLYLEIEMRTGHLPHRHQAMMLINRLGQSPMKDQQAATEWPRKIARMYLEWAERKGYDREVYLLQPDEKSPGKMAFHHITAGNYDELIKRFEAYAPSEEFAIFFEGSNVFGFLKGERGTHKLVGIDGASDELCRVQVFAIPDGTNISRWLSDYQYIKNEIAEGKRPPPPTEKLTVIRTYSLEKQGERFVRDMRTTVRTTRIKDVMEKGRLDDFILAYLQQEDENVAWEDRFPPTFPFERRVYRDRNPSTS